MFDPPFRRLYQRCKHSDKSKQLPCPAMNTHDAVTKTCMDNYYRDGENISPRLSDSALRRKCR